MWDHMDIMAFSALCEYNSRADLLQSERLPGGRRCDKWRTSYSSKSKSIAQGAEYIPVGTRPNPFLGAGFFWFTEDNSAYNALETEVTHRLSQGLQVRANYTWSKNLDVNSGLTGAQANNQAQMVLDRNDLRRDLGLSALNVTGQAGISTRYELPFGRYKPWFNATRGLERKLVSGWQLNGIATFLTGFPFTPLVGSNLSGGGDIRNPDRPTWNPNFSGPILLHNQKEWFNPNAFARSAAGTYGNLGRGTFTGPDLADVDFSLLKKTSLTERTNLEFRAEFFNLFNGVNFGPPNTTVFASGTVSASAGLITTLATNPRQIQFGLKLIFSRKKAVGSALDFFARCRGPNSPYIYRSILLYQ